ncbi:uncharacterized protein C8A04DRAFT_24703 [Dichotomopilus funicola]|uniref:Uncharacterized protein n=1 Tax=Dichotomopilus funicola TaxID=1934379 RepID=A0AAN6V9R6_9PEZI|nr:hypothetical protein C8A04DRAFT_24703 [Dichotomopilus funicola]
MVDLPGLSDVVQSRADVATKFARKIDITVIVTPARRAIDEKTGVQLMSDYQTLRMQLEGKYHKKSFCVVVSQVDEIDCDIFMTSDVRARRNELLQADTALITTLTGKSAELEGNHRYQTAELARAKAKLAKLETKIATLQLTGGGSQKKPMPKHIQQRLAKALSSKKELEKGQQQLQKAVDRAAQKQGEHDRALRLTRGRQKWECVWLRNQHIIEAIKRDFAQRQKTLARGMKNQSEYDGSVDVIPVSATAFRDQLKGREPLGFMTAKHTGIPKLRQFLGDVTLEKREQRLDAMLNTLRRLFRTIHRWTSPDAQQTNLLLSRDTIEKDLTEAHKTFRQGIERELEKGRKAVKRSTYNAILKRDGGPYHTARGRAERREYNFPESMTPTLLSILLNSWHQAFRIEMPQTEAPILDGVARVWKAYLDEVDSRVRTAAELDNCLKTVGGVQDEVRDRVKAAIRELADCSREVHPEFLESVRGHLRPMPRPIQRPPRAPLPQSQKTADHMFSEGQAKMRSAYQHHLQQLGTTFRATAAFATEKTASEITLLLDRLSGGSGSDSGLTPSSDGWTAEGMDEPAQKRVLGSVNGWGRDWCFPNSYRYFAILAPIKNA